MVRELNIGGTERQCAEMARSLDAGRFTAHVGCFRGAGYRATELERAGVPVLRLPVQSLASAGALRGLVMLRQYIRHHQIQIVHTFDFPMNLYASPAARLMRVPVVITSQRQSRDLYPSVRPWLRITDRLSSAIVVNSDAVRREMMETERVPEPKLHLCYNGIDTALFQPRDLEASPATLTIGTLCALRPEKDLLTLAEAFHLIRDLHPRVRLVIVGDGVLREPLARRAAELNFGDRFHLEPSTDDVPGWLRRMDIFVLPSVSEALSNSLMEAMATGCAPVASQVGGNPELVKDSRTGLLFEAGNAADLAHALDRLIVDSNLRLQLGRAASAFIHERFSLRAGADCLGALYEQLLASDGKCLS
jgi:glycosyltransferase involved in cell wall biosynthesis